MSALTRIIFTFSLGKTFTCDMKRHTSYEYRPTAKIDREAAEHMHRLGAAYAELALYWLSSGAAPDYLARSAYELACMIHCLARAIDELVDERSQPHPQ